MSEERIGSGRLESLEHLKLDAADLLKACQVVQLALLFLDTFVTIAS